MNPAPELAVVVLSYRNDNTILAALDSLIAQQLPLEIIVSHSGGGDTPRLLRRRHPEVPVVAVSARRLPGAARNAGVAATTAPFIAFLAADCSAAPGWAAGRLARHRAGAAAVASAMAPIDRCSPGLASHLLLHSGRLPGLEPPAANRFGVSYARALLDRLGPFPESLPFGEDVVLNRRLISAREEIVWAPEVVTVHRYPTSILRLLEDQYRQGRVRGTLSGSPGWRCLRALQSLGDAPKGFRRARRGADPALRRALPRVAPLVVAGAVAKAAGVACGRLAPGDADGESIRLLQAHYRRPTGRVGAWTGTLAKG